MVSALLLKLLDDMGTGLSEATIRGRLSNIHEQAKAAEADFKRVKTEIKETKALIEDLEAKLQQQNPAENARGLNETAAKILVIFFRSDRTTLEQAARQLGIETGVAEYHADALSAAGMIEIGAITPAGSMYILTPTGRAYVVENKLV
jgi:DNA-binding MarR family transcriptional regulator